MSKPLFNHSNQILSLLKNKLAVIFKFEILLIKY
jgi:hypothetical protein